MSKIDKNNAKVRLRRYREFETYAKWFSLSPVLRLLSEDQLNKLGIDSPEELELLKIKNQREFARKFKIGEDVLSEWKQREDFWQLVDKLKKQWGKSKTPSVLVGFFKKAVSEADAARVKLWLEYFEDWKTKSEIDINQETKIEEKSIEEIVNKISDFLKEKYKK